MLIVYSSDYNKIGEIQILSVYPRNLDSINIVSLTEMDKIGLVLCNSLFLTQSQSKNKTQVSTDHIQISNWIFYGEVAISDRNNLILLQCVLN